MQIKGKHGGALSNNKVLSDLKSSPSSKLATKALDLKTNIGREDFDLNLGPPRPRTIRLSQKRTFVLSSKLKLDPSSLFKADQAKT